MDLSAFTNPANILTVFVAVATFATLVTLAAPLMRTNNLEARLKSVSTRREELRRKSREALAASKGGSLRQTDAGLYKRVVDRLQLSRLLEDPKVVDKLAQAGFRGPRPVSTFYFFRFVLPFAFAASVAFYLFVINDFGLSGMNRLAAIVVGLTLGYYAPNIYISNIAQKRRESIVGAFPDALDLLLICVESGMSIEAAIQKVSQEIGGSSIELAEEMTLLTAELSYLPERRQAYEGLSRRTNHPGIKSVTTAMIQAERYGTPLGAALRVMAKENRDLRLAAAEKTAAQLPAKLTVPMIVFFLPVLFLVILGPAVLRVMDMMAPGAS
ncbi:MAG: type II secretion system F family protein [Phenylobacterium sp.]|uniref:type II secretion system F family protein n=1 Tax=Phenylobacterium sp. TaxID=1871053 RepID=UPI0027347377|nr:type II secretion system F family protein [Phenylobacterium sp.]MDP1641783.1 type II secretion system F family protein [Phenylobacterium sp.]MDP3115828.1 type II secretion system F family protein [Phenylobacterium sp.]